MQINYFVFIIICLIMFYIGRKYGIKINSEIINEYKREISALVSKINKQRNKIDELEEKLEKRRKI